ncbi:MAG: alpha-L-fucosidase [Bacteroidales bacterium]|nr:alpha-L-fucosidase [Bacteroidales bacterium]
MKKIALLIVLCLSMTALSAQKVLPTWESLNQRPYPQWFADAKLGIFIHWGIYSVPSYASLEGYGEWYYRGLMLGDTDRVNFQNRVFGNGEGNFQYKDFLPYYKAELFDANEWAQLFKRAGAQYVLLVTKHHDGYCLWDSKYQPEWNSVVSGPHRNIVTEVTDAVRAAGMKMGFYYSLLEWTNPLHKWTVDPTDSIGRYVDEYMIPQFKELVMRYNPSVLFSDGDWDYTADQLHSAELISWYYNTVGPEAIVNDRWGNGNQHGFRTPEYSSGITLTDRPWAECRGLGRSFGLNRNEPLENYLTSESLIRHFAKLVAAGGGMTLNVGPAADGQIPLLQQERLLDLGKWLQVNGEAIYGTRPYEHFYEMEKVKVARTDPNVNFDWKRNSPDPTIAYDHFTAEWNGTIRADYSEPYTFEVETDDAFELWIDGNKVVQYNPADSNVSKKGTFSFKAGHAYNVKIIFKEKDMEAVAILRWSSPSHAKEVVPAAAFGQGLWGEYSCEQPYICYTTKGETLYAIALRYPQDELVLNVAKPDHKLTITMLGCDKVLPYKYKNGQLIINTSSLKYTDVAGVAAWAFRIK